MRVLFLNPTGHVGGAESVLLEMLAGLRRARPSWSLGLIAATDGPLVSRARALGVEVRVLPFPTVLARFGERSFPSGRSSRFALAVGAVRAAVPSWRYMDRLRTAVRAFSPDVVHTNGLKMHVLGAWATPAGSALLWHLHDYVVSRPLSAALLRRYAHRCSAIVTNSRSVASDVRRLGGALPPIRAIWNSVDLARFSSGGDTLDLDERAGMAKPDAPVIRVGLVATFAAWKGHQTFLEAIARLPPALDVRAYVIGGPVYETERSQVSVAELRDEARRLGIGARVGFTGFVEDPAPAMRALDIVVHASTEQEPFGLTIAEAMACGRSVITSLAGGAAEIVTADVDALAFAPGDARALGARIEALASDRGLRTRLGLAAAASARERFDRQRFIGELLEVYAGLPPARGPLRVLHVHSGNLYGGVETFLGTLARDAAAAPDMTPIFALCHEGRLSRELRACGYRVHMLGPARVSRPLTAWRARRKLKRLIGELSVDVAVCHQAWPLVLFGSTIRRTGVPRALWVHTVNDGRYWLDRLAARVLPDLAIVNSRFTAENVSRVRPNTPLEIVYYPLRLAAAAGIVPSTRSALRASLTTPDDDIVIVQVGRLESLKGNREAIEALGRLREVPGWTYWVVGGPQRASDDQYLDELKKGARRAGVSDRVRFAGERHDVPVLLQAADIYCQPNIVAEPFGIALVEAQAAGLPIVTSALGGAIEIVDESCGLLVPAGDVDGVAAALRRLLGDSTLRARLGRGARQRSNLHCDLARQMRRTHDVLSSVAPGRQVSAAAPPVLGSSAHS